MFAVSIFFCTLSGRRFSFSLPYFNKIDGTWNHCRPLIFYIFCHISKTWTPERQTAEPLCFRDPCEGWIIVFGARSVWETQRWVTDFRGGKWSKSNRDQLRTAVNEVHKILMRAARVRDCPVGFLIRRSLATNECWLH